MIRVPSSVSTISPLVALVALACSGQALAADCPETILVDSASDATGELTTLEEAIAEGKACSGNANIVIDESLAGQVIYSGSGSFYLDGGKSMSIQGPQGGRALVQPQNDESSFFSIDESASLNLSNLELDGQQLGRSASALSVESAGSKLELDNVKVTGFYGGLQGPGIQIRDSIATIKHSEFTDNQSSNSCGGAIALMNTTGASQPTLEIIDSVFDGNTAKGDTTMARGGAICSYDEYESAAISVSGSTFRNNQARNYGGALYSTGRNGLVIENSVFENNHVITSNYLNEAHGGALAFYAGLNASISGSTFRGNIADDAGGAVYIGQDSMDAIVTISDSSFEDNQAQYTGAEATLGQGGALYFTASAANPATLAVTGSTFSGNSAIGTNWSQGGALYAVGDGAVLTLENSTLANNSAAGYGGALFLDKISAPSKVTHSTLVGNSSSYAYGAGAIHLEHGDVGDVVISHSLFSGNSGAEGSLCVTESSAVFAIDHSFIDDATPGPDCQTNVDNGGNLTGGSVSPLDAKLGELADNGGSTRTFYPEADSPVVDAGDADIAAHPETDQRGNDRTMRNVIDIGAVEYGNLAPTAEAIPNAGVLVGEALSLDVSGYFADPEGDALSYALDGLPDGFGIDGSGLITGSVDETGNYSGRVIATDAYGASVSAELLLVVSNDAPGVHPIENQSLVVGSAFSLDIGDNFNDPNGHALSFRVGGLPDGLGADGSLISGNATAVGESTVLVTATDAYGASTSTSFTITVTNSAPVAAELADLEVTVGDELNWDLSAAFSDADGHELSLDASGLPAGLVLAEGVVTGTVTQAMVDDSPYQITLTATDGYASAEQQVGLTVVAADNGNGDTGNKDGGQAEQGASGGGSLGGGLLALLGLGWLRRRQG
ncbi:putative Ig domain-containing protein [Gallaecimonas sp. GXIMD4217]|uniref:putative Ig domain-containing protein n=1 Tax=Gallaecimonas sp. GXIMD4217 TaxID=3131927 RepID=UPI00311B0EAB